MLRCSMAILFLITTGCTHVQLRRSTVNQASTISDLQSQQVLNNLAMFSCNPHALASHLKLQGGLVQVADTGSAGFVADLLHKAQLTPNVAAQRGVVGQWDVEPTVESDQLELLQVAYQLAIYPGHPGYTREAYMKICELCVRHHVIPKRDLATEILEQLKIGESPQKQNDIDVLILRLGPVYDRIEEISSHPGAYPTKIPERAPPIGEREFQTQQVLKLLTSAFELPYVPYFGEVRAERNVAVIAQTQNKIGALLSLVEESDDGLPNPFSTRWVCFGSKRDVPKCVCYVGRYRGCEGDRYAWVPASQQAAFRDFILVILRLAPLGEQDIIGFPGRGAAFSPTR